MATATDQRATLVERLDTAANAAPRSYKLRVLLLALLGYLYIFAVLAVLVGLIVGLVIAFIRVHRAPGFFLKLGLPLLGLTILIVRSLWIRFSPPEGRVLGREEAAPLFDAVEAMRRTGKAPAVYRILLDDEFNAAVVQFPRFGLFGFHRNYLCIGLPLLLALTPEQFRAVLAHELGHLSGAHGRFGTWIYRMRGVWAQLLGRLLRDGHWGARVFIPFFSWYAPFFGAHSFALARAQEYAADRAAAEATDPRQAADALVAVALRDRFLDEQFWPGVARRAQDEPRPPAPLRELRPLLRAPLPATDAEPWLAEALRAEADPHDTHPRLAARLAALGQVPRLPEPPAATAAEWIFGDALDAVIAEFDGRWQADVEPGWAARHGEARAALAGLRDLDVRAQAGPLTAAEALQRAEWTEEFGEAADALPRYREALDRAPDSADAAFAIGRLQLEAGDAAGIAALERAMASDERYAALACRQIVWFLRAHDRAAEAAPYEARLATAEEVLDAAHAERGGIGRRDTFLPHSLDAAGVAAIAEPLVAFPHVAEAHLARKELCHFADQPVYVLGIVIKQPWYLHRSPKTDRKVAQAVADAIAHPAVFYVVPLNNDHGWLRKALKAIPDAPIYRRVRR